MKVRQFKSKVNMSAEKYATSIFLQLVSVKPFLGLVSTSLFLMLTISAFVRSSLAAPPSGIPRCSELSGSFTSGSTKCYTSVDVNLSIRESFDRRSFDKTFSPADLPGFVVVDHYREVISRTGNADITVGTVASGARVVSSSEVSSREKALFDFLAERETKAKAKGYSVKKLDRLKINAASEFESYKNAASRFESSTAGVNISAYAEAICDVRNRVFGGCAIWGSGGNMNATVYIVMLYVGQRRDVNLVSVKYIDAAKALEQEWEQKAQERDLRLQQAYMELSQASDAEKSAWEENYQACRFDAISGTTLSKEEYTLVSWHTFHDFWQRGKPWGLGCPKG
jgi:hypothetical protein